MKSQPPDITIVVRLAALVAQPGICLVYDRVGSDLFDQVHDDNRFVGGVWEAIL